MGARAFFALVLEQRGAEAGPLVVSIVPSVMDESSRPRAEAGGSNDMSQERQLGGDSEGGAVRTSHVRGAKVD